MRIKIRHAELPFDKALGVPLVVCVSLGLGMGVVFGGRALRMDARSSYEPGAAPSPPVYDPEPFVNYFRDDRGTEVAQAASAQNAPLK